MIVENNLGGSLKGILCFVIFGFATILASFTFDNWIWVGQDCEASKAGAVCDSKPVGTSHKHFFTLQSCKNSYANAQTKFICAQGANPDAHENTIYSSFNTVYYSKNSNIINNQHSRHMVPRKLIRKIQSSEQHNDFF